MLVLDDHVLDGQDRPDDDHGDLPKDVVRGLLSVAGYQVLLQGLQKPEKKKLIRILVYANMGECSARYNTF